MTLDELNRIDVSDPDQVKTLQNFLKSRGYYNGPLDGKWGGGTVEGVKSLRTDLQTESGNKRAEAEARAAENSPAAEATRFATKFGPYAVGVTGGYLASRSLASRFDAKDAEQRGAVSRLAREKGVNPVIGEQSLDRMNRKRMMRGGTQFLAPAALFGVSELTRRYVAPQFDEKTGEYVKLGATAEQAAGGTLAVKQLYDMAKRSSPNDPVDEALIRSRAAEARGDPYTISGKEKAASAAAPKGPDPARLAELRAKRVADLRTEAKAMGLHVSGTKDDLARRIAEAPQQDAPAAKTKRLPRGKAGLLAPLAAGAIAYDAASSEAEAAGAEPSEAMGRGAAAGAGAAGLTVGASKLAPYALDAIGKTPLGRVAARAFPPAAAALTAYDVGSMAVDENAKPDTMLEGPQTGTMPQTPGNPHFFARQQSLARQTRGEAPLRSAAALEMPEGDQFEAQLQAFIQAIEEHNAGVGGGR